MERTLIIIKPDGMEKKLQDKIIARYTKAGFRITAKKEVRADSSLLRKHYSAHVSKPFYPSLEKFMSSRTVLAVVLEGNDAVSKARKITGATDPAKAEKGTVRADFGDFTLPDEERIMKNLVHASATPEEAKKEIALWFPELD